MTAWQMLRQNWEAFKACNDLEKLATLKAEFESSKAEFRGLISVVRQSSQLVMEAKGFGLLFLWTSSFKQLTVGGGLFALVKSSASLKVVMPLLGKTLLATKTVLLTCGSKMITMAGTVTTGNLGLMSLKAATVSFQFGPYLAKMKLTASCFCNVKTLTASWTVAKTSVGALATKVAACKVLAICGGIGLVALPAYRFYRFYRVQTNKRDMLVHDTRSALQQAEHDIKAETALQAEIAQGIRDLSQRRAMLEVQLGKQVVMQVVFIPISFIASDYLVQGVFAVVRCVGVSL
ncbi:unnamed protein product [Symbiodinium natans]|uniref:Uncharacterized protein n=1 Tax=Symbiodinium natans TaxID=878477 RepID=A0A812UFA8_9DINO|nr:unnamed protein product [Symbiodinium natans]